MKKNFSAMHNERMTTHIYALNTISLHIAENEVRLFPGK